MFHDKTWARATWLVLLVANACDAPAPPIAPAAKQVIVRVNDAYYTRDGVTKVRAPLQPFRTPRVRVRRPDGSFSPAERGAEIESGVFVLPVDEGPVYAALGEQYVVGADGEVDFGHDYVGRSDAKVAGEGTKLVLNATGMLPWADSHILTYVSPSANAFVFEGPFPAGSTAVMGLEHDWSMIGLISARRGDELWVRQDYNAGCAGGRQCSYPVASMHLTDLEQRPGERTSVSGTFQAGASEHLELELRLADFAALAGTLSKTCRGTAIELATQTFGKGDDSLDVEDAPDEIVWVNLSGDAGDAVISLDYHDPYPQEWPRVIRVGIDCDLPGELPRAQQLRLVIPLPEAESGPVLPIVGPPRNPHVERESTGLRVEWDAPSVGQADGYIVTLFAVAKDGSGDSHDYAIARYYTVDTSLAMVPETVDPVNNVYALVTAVAGDDVDLLHAPHRRGRRYGTADAATEVIRL